MLFQQTLIYTLLISIPLALASSKNRPKQCLRYRENDIFLDTCPAYSNIDFSAALFPDPTVISGLRQPENPQSVSTKLPTSDTTESSDSIESHDTLTDKPLVSFEEWQKKTLRDVETKKDQNRLKRKQKDTEKSNKRQMVDSVDGGFADDFGSMFEELIGGVIKKEKKPNVYTEKEYIAPSKQGEGNSNKKTQQFAAARMKSLKERFNYASTDCAATVRKANKEAKGAQSILYESKDQYLLNKCAADKFVIINLCEQIVVDTIVMANFEFFSSTFKDFRVYGSQKYPTDDWRLLGQWQARNTRDLQVFKVPVYGFNEFLKIEFLSHFGHEYYCPLSLIRVHGMPMMEYYRDVESVDEIVIEEEHLWPAEVREQIIQPEHEVANTSESFPIQVDVEEEDAKPIIIPPVSMDPIIEESTATTETIDSMSTTDDTQTVTTDTGTTAVSGSELETDSYTELIKDIAIFTSTDELNPLLVPHLEEITPTTEPTIMKPIITESNNKQTEFNTISTSPSASVESSTESTISSVSTVHLNSTSTPLPEELRTSNMPPPVQKVNAPNYGKQGSAQESIYKTIMKRLTVLEGNMTMSLRYLDDQNQNLNSVLKDMEKKHQDQLILLIGHLNETASHSIDSMKRRYEQWYDDLKEQTDSDMREMTAKIGILADQLSFERRVSVSQLVIMLTLFVFMALSRGTFSTLSPVMAAQKEERKRRESIDHSSVVSNTSGTESVTNTTPAEIIKSVAQKTSDIPKKPINPRRHTDNHYFALHDLENRNSILPRSRGLSNVTSTSNNAQHPNTLSRNTSNEKLGIDFQNETLHKKLGDIYLQQQEEQTVPLLSKRTISRKPSFDNFLDAPPQLITKNR